MVLRSLTLCIMLSIDMVFKKRLLNFCQWRTIRSDHVDVWLFQQAAIKF